MARTVEFPPDGRRQFVSAADVAAAWRSACPTIPAQYACGTAQHESTYTINEVDTEETGFVSKGIFQLSDEEAGDAKKPDADLLTLGDSVLVLSNRALYRLNEIVRTALRVGCVVDPFPPDVWAYLAIAHNEGLGAAEKTILAHGLDWAAWKSRNPHLAAMAAYGDDVISGGERWSDVPTP